MTRRRKPYNPAERQRAVEERRMEDENAQHAQQTGAKVRRDRGGRVTSIYRSNVFTRLLEAGSITQNHHDAAYRLAGMWAQWKGLEGRVGAGEPVDGGSGCAELVTDRMISGGRDVERTLSQVGPLDRMLLEAFMVETVENDRPMVWRGIVQRVTGISARDAQSTVVVMALENLRMVFEQPRQRAA